MSTNNQPENNKIRQNVSLSPRAKEYLRVMAKANECTMSALVTQWIMEKIKEPQYTVAAPAPPAPRPLRPDRTKKPKPPTNRRV